MTRQLDVVIPVRDVDRYLGEALDSVIGQRGVDCRVVVVDAGSARPILLPEQHQANPAVRLVRSDRPLTAGGGRNLGVAAGSAPWVTFLDADDRWPLDSRSALVETLEATGAGIAFGMMTHFHSDEGSRRLQAPEGESKALIAGGAVLSRASWQQVGPFDEELANGEFIEWYTRALGATIEIAQIADLVLERRVHLESTTANQILNRDDYLTVVRRWIAQSGS